ncbi:sensor histidine kinase [Isoptericola jiangsuensis]|uniref:sensor histidine kinase n=1 Tax=Isoptericola jiangsuensis TaxID=548579 RepID=UPI003AAE13FE
MTTTDHERPARTTTGALPSPDVLEDWPRIVRWWHLVFVAVVLLTAGSLVLGDVTGHALWTSLASLTLLLVAYGLWGADAAAHRDQGKATAYVTVLVATTTITVSQTELGTFLLFAAYSQIWISLTPVWRAVTASTALAVGVWLGLVIESDLDPSAVRAASLRMTIALVFAVLLGLWIAATIRRSQDRSILLQELRAAQEAAAASHHAAGVAAERERLAREIHDTLAQGFTSVVMQAQAATAALDRGEETAARDRLRVVEDTARENLAEARALVAAFAPVDLQAGSLPDALARLADRVSGEGSFGVHLEVDDAGAVTPDPTRDVVLLRAAQESLANVRRHAEASTVVLRLERTPRHATLEVVDDGRGIAQGRGEGFGITGMRERAAAVGGSLSVSPSEEGGTCVRVTVPVRGG